jgi:hypothetical protein
MAAFTAEDMKRVEAADAAARDTSPRRAQLTALAEALAERSSSPA